MHPVSSAWLYGIVKPYFQKKGITLLKDDMLFIERCLSCIPQDRHKMVMRDYLEIWKVKVHEKNSVQTTRVNPRYEANCYLRSVSGNKKAMTGSNYSH